MLFQNKMAVTTKKKYNLFVQEQILVEWGQDVLEANKETSQHRSSNV
jgi:hypothetical protein